ncbi:MAG TPA: head maturation protease, ClpP-related [Polyangiaceae bacterium]|nr:head maturation protease, ClpP-related [Polyangiaceae bacterium]
MSAKWGFKTRVIAAGAKGASKGKTIELDIYDDIGGWWGGVSAREVRRTLRENSDAATIRVRINSPGGDVVDGLAIYELLRDHQANVEIDIDSLAASMASVIAMAGDVRRIAAGGLFMIHNPWGFGMGESDDLRAHADLLDKMRDIMVGLYAARTKKSTAEITKWMDAETWFSAEEALAAGFVDSISPAKGDESKKARGMAFVALAANRSSFTNMPEHVISELPEDPEASLRGLLAEASPDPEPTPAPAEPEQQPINPGPSATENSPTGAEQHNMPNDNDPKTTNYASIIAALGLMAGAPETDILARIGNLKNLEVQSMSLLGVTDSAQLVGAIRGVKAKADTADALQTELTTVKGARDKQTFESLIAKGQADRKLTPAEAKHETEKFNAAVAEGRGDRAVKDLEGYLAVAPRKFAEPVTPAPLKGSGANPGQLTWNGKTYAELKPMQRDALSKEDPELFKAMRDDHKKNAA